MKDLIELVLKYFPRYLAEMGSILAGPKRFIRERNTNAVETFNDSLLFLGIGIVLYGNTMETLFTNFTNFLFF